MSPGSASGSPWVRALAPAKVNPFLEVLGRRADGYHEVETTLLALDLADRVAVRTCELEGVHLRVDGPFATPDVPRDGRNLAVAAAAECLRIARERTGRRGGLEIDLTKEIPSEAGLGGGSSDAAAALVASERALGIELAPDEARELLAKLGSDCVFFREAATTGYARARGRGERVESLPAPPRLRTLVVLTPSCRAPTAAVYRALADVPPALHRISAGSSRAIDPLSAPLAVARDSMFNALENAAISAVPELGAWRERLDASGAAHFRLCGSGSSFFGLFDGLAEAEDARARLLADAAKAGIGVRAGWITRPARAGARLVT
jgi:4-diphosphocytidyl-2-C-methyl-D-erythritol kinase